jgi:hypothetical protein
MSSLLVFCLGWSSNFVGSESGRKQSVKKNSCRIWFTFTTQRNTPHPSTATHCLYLYVYFGKRGGVGEFTEKVEGQQFTRGFEIPT